MMNSKSHIWLCSIFVILFANTLFAGAKSEVKECGKASEDLPQYKWISLAQVSLHAKIMNVQGLICAGLEMDNPSELALINYRDETGSTRQFTYKDLSTGRRILISQEDIGLSVIRKGPIMSLQVIKTTQDSEDTRYKVVLRFLRNLSALDHSPNDFRQLEALAILRADQGHDIYINDASIKFDVLELFISLGLTINKVEFKNKNTHVAALETSILPKVKEL